MNKIVGLRKDLSDLLEKYESEARTKGYAEGFEAGRKYDVVEGNTKINEISELKVGDKVKFIGEVHKFGGNVTKGKVYEISDITTDDRVLFVDDDGNFESRSMIRDSKLHMFEKVIETQKPKSPNQQRAELIQKAKEFVESKKRVDGYYEVEAKGILRICKVEFYQKNNRVTCVLKGFISKNVWSTGRSNCSPNDVFNLYIGQAISLARALQIDVPVEFLKAVQPTHYAVGQIVQRHDEPIDSNKKYRVDKIGNSSTLTMLFQKGTAICDTTKPLNYETEGSKALKVTDDTSAQYEVIV
jgi:hypothetical protein